MEPPGASEVVGKTPVESLFRGVSASTTEVNGGPECKRVHSRVRFQLEAETKEFIVSSLPQF